VILIHHYVCLELTLVIERVPNGIPIYQMSKKEIVTQITQ